MTESDWLVWEHPRLMLDEAFGRSGTGRKERLFACACCRRLWCLLTDARSQDALAVAEQLADNEIQERDLFRAEHAATAAICVLERKLKTLRQTLQTEERQRRMHGRKAHLSVTHSRIKSTIRRIQAAEAVSRLLVRWPHPVKRFPWTDEVACMAAEVLGQPERAIQARLLRDIAGNPYRKPMMNPAWLEHDERCAARIAQQIYDSGSFEDVPILGDALEDAGCTDEDILFHCRSDTEHVRGCWVVDLLLDKK